uniref:Uncharacterized protein n=1 Tax=Oryza punctata TaxID=4537 RepID=A0A0E0MHS0_ORYPU
MADLALSTVHALLGVIRKEAELLGGVRGDVQFIRDEMESINGLLRHLAGTKERASDHQVRAWIKQVMELAYDSNNCVETYARTRSAGDPRRRRRRKGFLGRLRWVARLPWAMWVRRRVATRIRQLKVRAREVGERQQRYGVAVPAKKDGDGDPIPPKTEGGAADGSSRPREYTRMPRKIPGGGDASRRQRAAVIDSECGKEQMLKECTNELIQWLDKGVAQDHLKRPKLSVVVIVAPDAADGADLVDKVYRHYKPEQPPSSSTTPAPTTAFQCRLRVAIKRPAILMEVIWDMLRQLQSEGCVDSMGNDVHTSDLATLTEKLKISMRGNRLLLFLTNVDYLDIWLPIEEVLASIACDNGSAVVLSSKDGEMARKLNDSESKLRPTKTVYYSHVDFHHKKANMMLPNDYSSGDAVKQVLSRCDMDDYCAKVFLHALHNNPNRTADELKILTENLAPDQCSNDPLEKRVRLAAFCYYGLPDRYKNCLWYAAAFIRGSYDIRRASLTRRWIAEGLIIRSGQPTEQEEAERCVDTLLSLNLLIPKERERGVIEGKVKTCSVNTPVIDIVNGGRSISASTVDDFLDTNQLPLDLDLHFSVRNGIRIRQLDAMDGSTTEPRPPAPKKQLESVIEFLRKLPSSSRLRLLRVLDLEGCGVIITNRHLNNICKIRKLKYLSLRGTDVAWLPKKLHQLELLETLDIRQTRVRVFESTLPKSLKHLLAGRVDCLGDDAVTVKSNESFSTVRMPSGIPAGDMSKLEILSHVWVSDSSKELDNLGEKLKQLRKLGVVLCGGSKANLKDLFAQINELHRTLRSLSIRMKPIGNWGSTEAVLMTPPLLLESLRIYGVRDWLPRRMKELNNLSKLTLRDTLLNEDNLAVLGGLKGLRCLRLRYHSFDSGGLTFSSDSFPNLAGLVIEDDMLVTITFAPGAAPKLAKIVWSFQRMESLTGIKNLQSLRRVELNLLVGNGATNDYPQLKQEIKEHPSKPVLVCQLIDPKKGGQVADRAVVYGLRVIRDDNFVYTKLPVDLAHRLPIHNGERLQQVSRIKLRASHFDDCWGSMTRCCFTTKSVDPLAGISMLLRSIQESAQLGLRLNVLDLEGCKGLEKYHLNSICKIFQLKYLSLRNTDVSHLPKKIDKLQYLETLDIRQTEIKAFPGKHFILPGLKHLLAGCTNCPGKKNNVKEKESCSFSTVLMPRKIVRMGKLEILCYAEVSGGLTGLIGICQLRRLRKLGKPALFVKRMERLKSANDDARKRDDMVPTSFPFSPPKFVQKLNISGIRSALLGWIGDLHQLSKITLHETSITEHVLGILGQLGSLRCLKLQCNSTMGSSLSFRSGAFRNLIALVVQDNNLLDIIFDYGAAPRLERVMLSIAAIDSLSGVQHLQQLKELELHGSARNIDSPGKKNQIIPPADEVYAASIRKTRTLKQAIENGTWIQVLNVSASGVMSVKLLDH